MSFKKKQSYVIDLFVLEVGDEKELLEEGTVSLPGGCILNMEQYLRFEDFKNNEYIEGW